LAQASSKAWAEQLSVRYRFLDHCTAELPAPGVENWLPLAVSTLWIL
jgi:hypothetical protein